MPYTLPPNNLTNGSAGIESILTYEAQQIPALMPSILLLLYVVILGAGYFADQRRTGRGKFAMWSAIAGLITTTGAFILFLYNGLINIEVVIIVLLITVVSVAFFLFSSDD